MYVFGETILEMIIAVPRAIVQVTQKMLTTAAADSELSETSEEQRENS